MRTSSVHLSNLLAALLLASVFTGCSPKEKKVNFEESAQKLFDAGEYEKAKIEYLNVLKLDGSNVTALGRLGTIWLEQGTPMRALPFLREACRLSPGDIPLRTRLMDAWMELGLAAEARAEAEAILKTAPTSGEALLLLTRSARNEEEVASARSLVAAFPDQNAAALHLATAALCLRDSDKAGAGDALTKALVADPKSEQALLLSADLLLKESDTAGATAKFKAAAEASPARSRYRIQYADFQSQQPTPEARKEARDFIANILREAPDYIPAMVLSAQYAMADKKLDEGMAILEKVFAIDAENVGARLLQSKGLMARGEAEKAIEVLEEIVKRFPGHVMAKFQLAQAFLGSASPGKAMLLLKEVVRQNPGFTEATLLLAELNLRNGDSTAVIPPVEAILKQGPGNAQATYASYLLAGAYEAQKRLDEAVKIMEELRAADPRDPRPHFRLGEILRSAGRNEESRMAFDEVLKLTPGNFTVTNQLIDLDLLDKKPDAAMARINEFIREKPDAAGAYLVKSRLHASARAWTEAEAASLKAIDLDPANFEASRQLASVYFASGKLSEAASRLEAVLAKNPKDGRALMQAAMIYEQQGDYAKAAATTDQLLPLLTTPSPMILNNHAFLLSERLNDPARALEPARKAKRLRPGTALEAEATAKSEAAAIADTLGWICYKLRHYPEAWQNLQDAGTLLKDNAEVQFHLGMAAAMMGDLNRASEALGAALQLAGDNDFPWKPQARARLELLPAGDVTAPPLTVSILEELQKKQPDDVLIVILLSEMLEKELKFPDAAAACEAALKLNPGLASVALRLARLYLGPLENPEKALEAAHKALALAPSLKVTRLLGEIKYKSGNFNVAYEFLKESARELKTDPGVLRSLALAAYSLGKVPEARETMQEVMRISPEPTEVMEAKAFLMMTTAEGGAATLSAALAAAEDILQRDPGYLPAQMVRVAAKAQGSGSAEAIAACEDILKRFPYFVPAKQQLTALQNQ